MNYDYETLNLPSYSPSTPSPCYSCELGHGERSLEHTPRSRSRPSSTSLFIKKAGKTTVVLNDQEDGAKMPTYGRGATISGNILLEQSETILDVVLKVKGGLDTMISEAGSQSIKVVDDSYTLWSQSSASGSVKPTCPEQLSFSVLLPTTFKHDQQTYPLPPTYNADFFSVPTLIVRSAYTLQIIIIRSRHKRMDIWTKTKQILVPFTYVPRTRSHRPILPSPCFFSDIKSLPEEWYQAVTQLKTRPNVLIDPLHCHLFVPGSRIYGISDTIPFHIQLSGNIRSLKDIFSGVPLDRITSIDSRTTIASKEPQSHAPLLRVYLLRQISMTVKGTKGFKNITLGEGTIWPIPPDLNSCCSSISGCQEDHVDWEGELRCSNDVTAGGFEAGNVHVKDFIILTVTPPNPLTSPLLHLQITIPIRLVTDSWSDVTILDPSFS